MLDWLFILSAQILEITVSLAISIAIIVIMYALVKEVICG